MLLNITQNFTLPTSGERTTNSHLFNCKHLNSKELDADSEFLIDNERDFYNSQVSGKFTKPLHHYAVSQHSALSQQSLISNIYCYQKQTISIYE